MTKTTPRPTPAFRRVMTLVGAGVLIAGATVPVAVPASATDRDDDPSVTYPTPTSPAAAEADEWFDIDVELPASGTLEASIRPAPRGHGGPDGPRKWIPLKVATEAPGASEAGSELATAKAPADTRPGRYELRVEVTDEDGDVIGAHQSGARGSVLIEDHELQTGFESVDGQQWTTFEQEQDFLAQLSERSPRTQLTRLGDTVNGLPYNILAIGAPAPPSLDDIDGDAALLVCSQHGNEPSGREACLQDARRLALSDDARIQEYLSENTVLIIPSANPDGSVADTRRNGNDVDLNRDHLRLEEPETKLLARIMRDTRPETMHDLHEMGGQDRPHLEVVWGRHLGIDEAVRDFGVAWGDAMVRPRAEAAGFTTGPYLANPGGGENTTLTNGSMLRNMNGVISETNRDVLLAENETPQSAQLRRVESQRISIHETLLQHRLHKDDMAQARDVAEARNIEMGYTQEGPYYFGGNSEDPAPPPPDTFIMDVPCGYLLTAEQAADRAEWMELFEVTALPTSEPGYAAFVPMWQKSSSVIPMMFDARALGSNLIEAEPVMDCSAIPSAELG